MALILDTAPFDASRTISAIRALVALYIGGSHIKREGDAEARSTDKTLGAVTRVITAL